jgi:phage baseplate assembly protein W
MADEVLGKDIALQDSNDLKFSVNQDFDVVSGRNNLAQAITIRLNTHKGELMNVNYGSELYKCFGEPKDDALKTRITGYVYEAMLQEPRVATVNSIVVTYPEDRPTEAEISLSVTPIESTIPLNLVFPLFIA